MVYVAMILLSRLLPLHRRGTALVSLGAAVACCPQSRAGSSQARCRRLRVLVDMDGVIADFEGGFLKKYRARYPDELYIPLEDRKGFWVSEQYGKLRPELCEKAISIWEAKNFFLDLDPIPGAVEAVKHMASLEEDYRPKERQVLEDSLPSDICLGWPKSLPPSTLPLWKDCIEDLTQSILKQSKHRQVLALLKEEVDTEIPATSCPCP